MKVDTGRGGWRAGAAVGRGEGVPPALGWAVLALVLVAFCVRAYHLDFQSLWRDEVDALLFATRDLGTVLGNFTKIGENGPLYFLLLRYWIASAGESEFSLRFFSLVFGVLTVPLAFAFGRRILTREVGLFAGLLTAVSPYYVWYSQEAKMYALLAFLSLLSVYLYLRALDGGGRRIWIAYVAVTSLALYVHFFSALLVAFEGFLFVAGLPRPRAVVRPWTVAFGLLTLPYLPLAIWQWPLLLHPPLPTYPFLDLGSILTVLAFAWSLNSSPVPVLFPLTFFVFLALAGLLLYPRGRGSEAATEPHSPRAFIARWRLAIRSQRGVSILAAYLLVPIVGFYLVSLRLPLFTDRYLMVVAPAYSLLLACGLVAVKRRSLVAVGLCLAVVLGGSAYSIWFQSHARIKSDFKSAARYVADRSDGQESFVFVMPYVQVVFSYYFRSPFVVRQAPYANAGLTPETVADQLAWSLSGERRLWLILSEEELYDARGLIKAWLDRNGRLIESGSFARVALYRYDLAGTAP